MEENQAISLKTKYDTSYECKSGNNSEGKGDIRKRFILYFITCFTVNWTNRVINNENNWQLSIRRKNILLVTSDMIMLVGQANASLST